MKSRREFLVQTGAIAVGTAVLGVPALARAQQKMVMKAADVHALGYRRSRRSSGWAEARGRQNGRLSIQMFPAMQLGGEKEMIEQAQVGALQIARISTGPMGRWSTS